MPTVVIDDKNVQEFSYNENDIIEEFYSKRFIYTCCFYFCAWMICFSIIAGVITFGYFLKN